MNSDSKLIELENAKLETKAQLDGIKSIQLEFVRHSKLSRTIDQIDKQIEKLKCKWLCNFVYIYWYYNNT
jgi:hypothetical protein